MTIRYIRNGSIRGEAPRDASRRHRPLRTSGRWVAWWLVCAAICGCNPPSDASAPRPQVVEAERALPPMALGAAAAAPREAGEPNALPPIPPAPDPVPPPPPEEHRITVRPGETLGLYERWSGIPEEDLKEENGLRRARNLRVGKSFTLTMTPEEAVAFSRMRREFHRRREEAFFRTHEVVDLMAYVVRPGDSLRAISKRFSDVPRWLMEKVNQGHDLTHLRPGDIVNLPVVREAPPASQREVEARAAAIAQGRAERAYRVPRPHGRVDVQRPPLDERPSRTHRPARRRSAWADGDGAGGAVAPSVRHRAAGQTWFSDPVGDGAPKPQVVDVRVKVRKGECLALYTKWSGVSTARIAATNDLLDPSRLRVGQTLRIPLPEPKVSEFYEARRQFLNGDSAVAAAAPPSGGAGASSFVYTVRSGETAWEIAVKRFDITLQDLARLNPTVNLDRLRAGDTLRIPGNVIR